MADISQEGLKEAITYFYKLLKSELVQEEVGTRIPIHELDKPDYWRHLDTSLKSSARLDQYGLSGLEYLASHGFKVPESVKVGESQRSVESQYLTALIITSVPRDAIEQILRVLSAYSQILTYEEQVENLRKVRIVDEAMRISGR